MTYRPTWNTTGVNRYACSSELANLMLELHERLGPEAYYAWASTLLDGVVLNQKAYAQAIQRKLDELNEDCTCGDDRPDDQGGVCPACRRWLEQKHEEALPF